MRFVPIWEQYDENGFGPDPEGWTSWFELLIFEPPKPPAWVWEGPDYQEPCPGEGHCHGCRVWCRHCGDTQNMCSADRYDPGEPGCDIHRKYPPKPRPVPTEQLRFGFAV